MDIKSDKIGNSSIQDLRFARRYIAQRLEELRAERQLLIAARDRVKEAISVGFQESSVSNNDEIHDFDRIDID